MPESSKDTTEAAIAVFNSRLDLNINNEHIDRSHRLGQPRSDTDSETKRRSELLKKVRSFDNVECAWTIDGRIICLLADGKKLAVQTERDVPAVRGQ